MLFRSGVGEGFRNRSNTGCVGIEFENGSVLCSCNHLTHFAILLSPGVVRKERRRKEEGEGWREGWREGGERISEGREEVRGGREERVWERGWELGEGREYISEGGTDVKRLDACTMSHNCINHYWYFYSTHCRSKSTKCIAKFLMCLEWY